VSHHLTINGQPLCSHTAEHGRHEDDDANLCQHAWKESAEEVARVWRAFKGLDVRVETGHCPLALRDPQEP